MSHRRSIDHLGRSPRRRRARGPAAAAAASTTRRRPTRSGSTKPKRPVPHAQGLQAAKKSRLPRRSRPPSTRRRPATRSRSPHGTYRESVKITGAKKRYLQAHRRPEGPDEGHARRQGRSRAKAAERRQVNGADQVTVNGFSAQNYKANGFFVVNVTGYTLTNLVATSSASTASTPSTPWAARSPTPRPRGTTTRASTSARRRRRPSRCARSSRTSSPTATCSAGRARTCAT